MAVVVGMKNPNDHAEPTKKSNAKNKIILLTSYVSNTLLKFTLYLPTSESFA